MKTLPMIALAATLALTGCATMTPNMPTSVASATKNVTLVVTANKPCRYSFSIDGQELFYTGSEMRTEPVITHTTPGDHEMYGDCHENAILTNSEPLIRGTHARISEDVHFEPNTTYNITCSYYFMGVFNKTDCLVTDHSKT
jgi:hypothetical protein